MHGVDRVPLWAVPASQPAEALFEFIVDGDCWRFQLIESGSVLGVEVQILVKRGARRIASVRPTRFPKVAPTRNCVGSRRTQDNREH